jgi:coenzyme F420-reducing hydrogenase delta subunit
MKEGFDSNNERIRKLKEQEEVKARLGEGSAEKDKNVSSIEQLRQDLEWEKSKVKLHVSKLEEAPRTTECMDAFHGRIEAQNEKVTLTTQILKLNNRVANPI